MLEKVLHDLIRVGRALTLGRGRCNPYHRKSHTLRLKGYFDAKGNIQRAARQEGRLKHGEL